MLLASLERNSWTTLLVFERSLTSLGVSVFWRVLLDLLGIEETLGFGAGAGPTFDPDEDAFGPYEPLNEARAREAATACTALPSTDFPTNFGRLIETGRTALRVLTL